MVLEGMIGEQVAPSIEPAPYLKDIIETTAEFYRVDPQAVAGDRRTKAFTNARHVAMYLCREIRGATLNQIGQRFGNRDHTTVHHAWKRVARAIAEHAEVSADVEEIKRRLCGGEQSK